MLLSGHLLAEGSFLDGGSWRGRQALLLDEPADRLITRGWCLADLARTLRSTNHVELGEQVRRSVARHATRFVTPVPTPCGAMVASDSAVSFIAESSRAHERQNLDLSSRTSDRS